MEFIPYGKQSIDKEDIQAVVETLQSDFLTTGPKVQEFETAIANYCSAKYCVAVSNGTAALHLASLCLLGEGYKVLTTPNSFLATANAIRYVGAKPLFVDIQSDGNIDLELCEEFLKNDPTIKAIYAVAFSGHMVDQKKLQHLKETYDIVIVEDCAHAMGAKEEEIQAGSCKNSDCSVFSFHPVKHMTTGEGGAITTNSKELYDKLLTLRAHGIIKTPQMKPWEYEMRELGYNYRITDIGCALGLSQLNKLDQFIQKRIQIAKKYDQAFKDTPVKPLYTFDHKSSYHLYVVLVDFSQLPLSKEELFVRMKEKSIGLQLHYSPINKQPYYKQLGYEEIETPVMDTYYQQCLSLPIYPTLKEEEQHYVIESLFEVLRG